MDAAHVKTLTPVLTVNQIISKFNHRPLHYFVSVNVPMVSKLVQIPRIFASKKQYNQLGVDHLVNLVW